VEDHEELFFMLEEDGVGALMSRKLLFLNGIAIILAVYHHLFISKKLPFKQVYSYAWG
jgi:hypothetical protein